MTLPINDAAKDTHLTIRFVTKDNKEVSKTNIDLTKLVKDQVVLSRAQPMVIEGVQANGELQMKIRYNTGKASVAAKLPASLPQ